MRSEIYIWGSPVKSAWEISDELTQLRVSHTIRMGLKFSAVQLKSAQPRPVHVTDVFQFKPGVNFIVGSYAALAQTNIPVMKDVKDALQNPIKVQLQTTSMSALDYVRAVAKPSVLNRIQTLVYKIQPYSLRKEVQAKIIQYFTGQISISKMANFLKRSYKTTPIYELLESGDNLRKAIEQHMKYGKTAEELEVEFGVPAFEIRYLTKERK